jgi:hypothetical protein
MRESLIRKFNERMVGIETRLTRLECPHKNYGFEEAFYLFSGGYNRTRTCLDCGKVLEVYPTCESWLAAKADQAEEELINMRHELDKERTADDRKAKKAKT